MLKPTNNNQDILENSRLSINMMKIEAKSHDSLNNILTAFLKKPIKTTKLKQKQ